MNLADNIKIAPVTADELSDVRYVHETSVRLLTSCELDPPEIEAWIAYIRSARYSERLLDNTLLGARIFSELVGTVSWAPCADSPGAARVRSIFTRPFFTHAGVGKALLTSAEAEAMQAGYSQMNVTAPSHAAGFFETMGYNVSSYGVSTVVQGVTLSAAFVRKPLGSARTVSAKRENALV